VADGNGSKNKLWVINRESECKRKCRDFDLKAMECEAAAKEVRHSNQLFWTFLPYLSDRETVKNHLGNNVTDQITQHFGTKKEERKEQLAINLFKLI
jgi:hypothetical protein